MTDQQVVPAPVVGQTITLDVGAWGFGRQQVTRHRIVPTTNEGITHDAGKLAQHSNSHSPPPRVALFPTQPWQHTLMPFSSSIFALSSGTRTICPLANAAGLLSTVSPA